MRNRIFLGTALAALTLLVTAEAAQAQFYVRGGRGGFSAGYGPTYGYGGYGYGGYRYGGYGGYYGNPYRSYNYSPYVYSSPYGYSRSWYEPGYYDSYSYAAPLPQPAPSVAQGQLRVVLPNADAQLWIENVPMQRLGTERVFATPPLESGKTYTYHLRARWMDGDREVSKEREVIVRAGEEATVNFREAVSAAP